MNLENKNSMLAAFANSQDVGVHMVSVKGETDNFLILTHKDLIAKGISYKVIAEDDFSELKYELGTELFKKVEKTVLKEHGTDAICCLNEDDFVENFQENYEYDGDTWYFNDETYYLIEQKNQKIDSDIIGEGPAKDAKSTEDTITFFSVSIGK